MDDRVTTILPTRNAARFLSEALTSLAAQTHRAHQVLAWDNGSTDDTVGILARWIPSRIPGRVVADAPFANLGECLAAMVAEADTEWVARMDADDVSHPDRLTRQLAEMARHPRLVGCGVQERRVDPGGRPRVPVRLRYTRPTDVRFALLFTNPIPHPGVLFRRSKVLAAGNYAPLTMGQDLDLWFRLTELGPLSQLPTPLLDYRVHPDSVSAARRSEWTAFQLGLVARYGQLLFPGAGEERVRLASAWARGLPDAPGRPADGVAALLCLARHASRAPAWQGCDFLHGRAVLDGVRVCRPARWHSLPLKVGLGLAGRFPAVSARLGRLTAWLGGEG